MDHYGSMNGKLIVQVSSFSCFFLKELSTYQFSLFAITSIPKTVALNHCICSHCLVNPPRIFDAIYESRVISYRKDIKCRSNPNSLGLEPKKSDFNRMGLDSYLLGPMEQVY